jgi:damage-control phosphatase, subfamily I
VEEKDGRHDTGPGTSIVRTDLECLPCFFGQITRTMNHAGVNGDRGRSIAQRAGEIVASASLDEVPARTSTLIHRLLRSQSGVDPYREVKTTYNRIALELLPELLLMAAGMTDRLEGGVRAAIAGNVIDFGIYDHIDLHRSIEESFQLELSRGPFEAFRKAVENAGRILYLCDNAGEIVFDRVLLRILQGKGKSVTVAVKGAPVINDATREDAAAAAMTEYSELIDNGSDGIGTLLESCSERFLNAYRSSDMIISKGQANFETLDEMHDPRLFFLFKVKCPVVARALGRENGDIVLMQGH